MESDIAIDVGTSRTKIFVPKHGIILDEPSVVTIDLQTDQPIAFGQKAYEMLGKTSDRFCVKTPLSGGVVSDFNVVQTMLNHFLRQVGKGKLTMPRIVACIPSEITDVEKRAIVNSISSVGVRKVFLIEEPVAAAIGSDLEISSPKGRFIVNIGGGTTDIAVITLNGIATSRSIKIAGNSLDEEIIKYLKSAHNLLVGKKTAEKIKIEECCVVSDIDPKIFFAKGRDCLSGMPKKIELNFEELKDILTSPIKRIVQNIKEILEETDPELVGDIFSDGIHLSGGVANLLGIKEFIHSQTNLPVFINDHPENAVILGSGKAIKYIGDLSNKSYGAMNPLIDEF